MRNNIPYLRAWLAQHAIEHEILIVDDGSKDDTADAAKALACDYLRNEVNSGKGAALKKGMLHARGDVRIFTDADIPFLAESFGDFLHALEKENYAMAIGDRTLMGSSYHREIPRLRKMASFLFSFLVGRFVAGGMFDTQCGLKGFRAEVARDLFGVSRMNGFTIDVELLSIAIRRKYTIKRLPVVLRSQEGASVRILKHSLPMMVDLFRIKFNHALRRYQKLPPSK